MQRRQLLIPCLLILLAATIPVAAEPAFRSFPEGEEHTIVVDADRSFLEGLSERQHRDQMLDWILYSVVADAGLSIEEQNLVLFDLAPARRPHLDAMMHLEHGTTRVRFIGQGRVVVVLPAGLDENERWDLLARAADEQRRNQGRPPEVLVPFEYAMGWDPSTVMVVRRPEVDAAVFFAPQGGYHRQEVRQLAELEHFMAQVDTLTEAHRTRDALVLGGRRLRGRDYGRLGVDDVAALWQSEQSIQDAAQAFETFEEMTQRLEGEFTARWDDVYYSTEEEREALDRRFDQEIEALHEQIRQAYEALQREHRQLHVGHSGFSLDPQYDTERLLADFDEIMAPFLETEPDAEEEDLCEGLDAEECEMAKELMEALGLGSSDTVLETEEVEAARRGLAEGDVLPLLEIVDRFERGESFEAQLKGAFLQEELASYQFQAARYDGRLQGTHVGMVLFYTDLLAKLWALDFEGSAPRIEIADFVPMNEVAVSPVFLADIEENASTRIWFDLAEDALQRNDADRALFFGHRASRILAASTEELRPGVEGEPSAPAEAFIRWWDQHFEEIARHEPRYETLDEIMKWGAVMIWLADHEASDLLGFLADYAVDRSHWFPTWVEEHPDLRFRDWDPIVFDRTEVDGVETESLPLLESEVGWFGQYLRGGVSLPARQQLVRRREIPETSDPLGRWAGLSYEGSTPGSTRALDGRRLERRADGGVARTLIEPPPTAKLRSLDSEVASNTLARSHRATRRGVEIDAELGETPLHTLAIESLPRATRVELRPRELDSLLELGRELSRAPDMEAVLLADHRVEMFLPLEDGGLAVKLRGSGREFVVRVVDEPTVDLSSDATLRVSDPAEGQRILELVAADRRLFEQALETTELVSFETAGPSWSAPLRVVRDRGPPESWRSVEITSNGTSFRAHIDPLGETIALRWAEVPPESRQNLSTFGRALLTERGRIHQLARRGEPGPLSLDNALAAAESPAQRIREVIERSRELAERGERGSALEALREAQKELPDAPELKVEEGSLLLDAGRPEAVARLELGGEPKMPVFFEELVRRLATDPSPSRQSFAEAVGLHQAQARGGVSAGEVGLYFDFEGKVLKNSLALDHSPQAAERIALGPNEMIEVGEGAQFFGDRSLRVDPQLLATHPSPQEIIVPMLRNREAHLVELSSSPVSQYRVDRLRVDRATLEPSTHRAGESFVDFDRWIGGAVGGALGSLGPHAGSARWGCDGLPAGPVYLVVANDDDDEDERQVVDGSR